jgi:hypothetical protein
MKGRRSEHPHIEEDLAGNEVHQGDGGRVRRPVVKKPGGMTLTTQRLSPIAAATSMKWSQAGGQVDRLGRHQSFGGCGAPTTSGEKRPVGQRIGCSLASSAAPMRRIDRGGPAERFGPFRECVKAAPPYGGAA